VERQSPECGRTIFQAVKQELYDFGQEVRAALLDAVERIANVELPGDNNDDSKSRAPLGNDAWATNAKNSTHRFIGRPFCR
jgi:hypothetical protein